MKTAYEVLMVSPHADRAAIRAAYRRLAKRTHPDAVGGAHGDGEAAGQRFRELVHAFEMLSDPERRAAYDAGLEWRPANRRVLDRRVAIALVVVGVGLAAGASYVSVAGWPGSLSFGGADQVVRLPADTGDGGPFGANSTVIRGLLLSRISRGDDLIAIHAALERFKTAPERREVQMRLMNLVEVSDDRAALTQLMERAAGSELAERARARLALLDTPPADDRPATPPVAADADAPAAPVPAASVAINPAPAGAATGPPASATAGRPPAAPATTTATPTAPTPRPAPVAVAAAPSTAVVEPTEGADAALPSRWTTYRGDAHGLAIDVPTDLLRPELPFDARTLRQYGTRDGEARLVISAEPNARGLTPAAYRRELISGIYAGATVTYAPLRRDWMVLAGHFPADGPRAGDMFYERVTFACDGRLVHGWRIFYPAAERATYSAIIERMHRSYRHTRGNGPHCTTATAAQR